MKRLLQGLNAHPSDYVFAIIVLLAVFVCGMSANAQDPPFPMQHGTPSAAVQDCERCMSYLDMVRTLDTIAEQEWALYTTFNRHWHPGAPPSGQTHTYEQLQQYMVDVMVDNSIRWHRLIEEWTKWTGIPPSNDTIPCEWTCTEWGACVDGVRRRQCVSNGHCHPSLNPSPPLDTACTVTPPPTAWKWATEFETQGQCLLVATAGANLSSQFGCPRVEGGVYYARDPAGAGYNEAYPCTITGVTEVRLVGYVELGTPNYQYLLRCTTHADGVTADIRKKDGRWYMDYPGYQDPDLVPRMDGDDLILTLPEPVVVTSLFGPNPWRWSATAFMLR